MTYGCHLRDDGTEPARSDEHTAVDLFAESELAALRMPAGYRRSITDWYARCADT